MEGCWRPCHRRSTSRVGRHWTSQSPLEPGQRARPHSPTQKNNGKAAALLVSKPCQRTLRVCQRSRPEQRLEVTPDRSPTSVDGSCFGLAAERSQARKRSSSTESHCTERCLRELSCIEDAIAMDNLSRGRPIEQTRERCACTRQTDRPRTRRCPQCVLTGIGCVA